MANFRNESQRRPLHAAAQLQVILFPLNGTPCSCTKRSLLGWACSLEPRHIPLEFKDFPTTSPPTPRSHTHQLLPTPLRIPIPHLHAHLKSSHARDFFSQFLKNNLCSETSRLCTRRLLIAPFKRHLFLFICLFVLPWSGKGCAFLFG